MIDLFQSKKEKIVEFIRRKGFAATHEVQDFCRTLHTTRASQDLTDLRAELKIRKLDEDEKLLRCGKKSREAIWTVV